MKILNVLIWLLLYKQKIDFKEYTKDELIQLNEDYIKKFPFWDPLKNDTLFSLKIDEIKMKFKSFKENLFDCINKNTILGSIELLKIECLGKNNILFETLIEYEEIKIIYLSISHVKHIFVFDCYHDSKNILEKGFSCDLLEQDLVKLFNNKMEVPKTILEFKDKYISLVGYMNKNLFYDLIEKIKVIYDIYIKLINFIYEKKIVLQNDVNKYISYIHLSNKIVSSRNITNTIVKEVLKEIKDDTHLNKEKSKYKNFDNIEVNEKIDQLINIQKIRNNQLVKKDQFIKNLKKQNISLMNEIEKLKEKQSVFYNNKINN